jgi:amidohydrolase
MEHCYGLIATIHGGKPGKTVALRTDIDGLPVKEETGLPFASKVEGCMHACGHDCHIAMLLGAAKILQENREELQGDVRLIVQPAEEICAGAAQMVAEGAMDGVDGVYGAHIWGNFDAPLIDVTPGKRMAGADLFDIIVEGTSAHCSAPHLGADAITAAAAIITNIQQYVSRINDPLNPLVVAIGTIHGGTRFNVVANYVKMEGTLRAFTTERHEEVLRRIVENTAEALGCKGRLEYKYVITPVINDCEDMNRIAHNAVVKLYGEESVGHLATMLGSEDFARLAEKAPHFFAFIGSRNKEKGIIYTNHHEKYTVDEDVLQRGSAVMAQFAVDFLAEKAQ